MFLVKVFSKECSVLFKWIALRLRSSSVNGTQHKGCEDSVQKV